MASYTFPRSSGNDFETWGKMDQKNIEGNNRVYNENKSSTLWEMEIERLHMVEEKKEKNHTDKVHSALSSLRKKIN